jgi:hypothetical protein
MGSHRAQHVQADQPRPHGGWCTSEMDAVERAVDDYIERHRVSAARELRYFRVLRSAEKAISQAALACLPSGKRHPHQRRIPQLALEESRDRLLENVDLVRSAKSFDELFDLVNALIRPISNIGELTVYDTAVRIGARFGLEPDRVYIHAGTRAGASALGFDRRRHTIEMSELPATIQRLSAQETEDLLCLYKSKLRGS